MKKLKGRLTAAVLSFLLLCSAFPAALAADGSSAESAYALSDYINNEVLAVYADGSSEVFSYDSQEALAEGLGALSAGSDIVWLQPNFVYENTGTEVDDPMFSEQWALNNDGSFAMEDSENEYPVFDDPFGEPAAPGEWTAPAFGGGRPGRMSAASAYSTAVSAVSGIDIGAETAWAEYDGGRDVVVALIDTGVDYTHEDLQDAIWTNTDEIAGNGIDDDDNGYVDDVYGWNFYSGNNKVYTGSEDDHGTHNAGTIAASAGNGTGIAGIAGMTENVKVMALKALGGREGSGTTESLIAAIEYAEANGASIANLSLGMDTFDYALYLAMKNSDLLFVVAAGNDGTSAKSYPAAYDLDNIISVANLSCDGTLSSSSNYGGDVDIAAPGTYILSTTTGGTYSYMTGTSMAAPMVSAVAALVYSSYEDISLPDVKQIILSSARGLDSLDGLVATGGMLDAGAALDYDLSQLSEEDDAAAETGTGSAPVISYTAGASTLTLTVSDADGDVCLLAYMKGEKTASDFDSGAEGTQVSLTDGSVTFRVVTGGTYTFYALDLMGNETVLTLTVSAQSGSGSPGGGQFRSRAPGFMGNMFRQ